MNEFFVPIELPSLNKLLSMHHMIRHKYNKKVGGYTRLFMKNTKCHLPCNVQLIRQGPRKLDEVNLLGSFKHVQDCIADCLIPGKAPGQADSDPRITWSFDQKLGNPKGFYVKLD